MADVTSVDLARRVGENLESASAARGPDARPAAGRLVSMASVESRRVDVSSSFREPLVCRGGAAADLGA
jgi:hypothetical protein